MVWAKISDTFYDDPVLVTLPRDDRLFLVEATTWCCKHETDGTFPKASVSRFTDAPDVAGTLARLVAIGRLRESEAAFELVDFLVEQRSKERIDADRAQAAFRQERSRRHKEGDHSTCTRSTFCPAGDLEPSRRDGHRSSQGESQRPVPTRPDPTSREGKGKAKGGASAPAPLRSQALPRPKIIDGGAS
jgi:hypothetical protein